MCRHRVASIAVDVSPALTYTVYAAPRREPHPRPLSDAKRGGQTRASRLLTTEYTEPREEFVPLPDISSDHCVLCVLCGEIPQSSPGVARARDWSSGPRPPTSRAAGRRA